MLCHVIPAKAGIQENNYSWTPAFAGVTALMIFYKNINYSLFESNPKAGVTVS
jgi:hypothetical protein